MSTPFVHSVYFWINPQASTQEIHLFEESVHTLLQVPGLKYASVGRPANTRREIIDFSYSYHLLLVFENQEFHDQYQTQNEVHQKFINDCKHLWYKIQIYDSVTI